MKLSFKDKFFYGFGSLGYATVAQTLSNFIMFFGTSVLGISGSLMGLAVSIGVLWDAVSDPILGHFSDRTNSAMGKRHPYLIVGTLGMCAVNLIIWLVPPASSEIVKFGWILISLLLVQTFCTFFSTPYLALSFDLTKDSNEQTSLQSFKTVFYLLGMMLPSVFMFIFMPSKNSQMGQFVINGYVNIAYVSSIICLICGLVTIFGTFKFGVCCKTNINKTKSKFTSVFSDFFVLLKKKEYRFIILGYSISLIASTVLTAAGLHMFTYSFHFSSKELSIIMASLICAAIFSQVVWNMLSKRRGKKQTLIFGLCIGILGIVLIWLLFMIRNLFPTQVLLYLTIPLIILSGFGTGVLYALPISIFCDVLSKDEDMKKNDKTATYAGIMTLSNKLSDAFALFFIGLMLDFIKFDSTSPVQSNSVQTGLGYIVILGVAISLTLSIFFYKKVQD